MEVYKNIITWPSGQLWKQRIPTPRSLQQLTTSLCHLAFKNVLLNPLGSLGFGAEAWITLLLPWPYSTPFFVSICDASVCLVSHCIWHRNMHLVTPLSQYFISFSTSFSTWSPGAANSGGFADSVDSCPESVVINAGGTWRSVDLKVSTSCPEPFPPIT